MDRRHLLVLGCVICWCLGVFFLKISLLQGQSLTPPPADTKLIGLEVNVKCGNFQLAHRLHTKYVHVLEVLVLWGEMAFNAYALAVDQCVEQRAR